MNDAGRVLATPHFSVRRSLALGLLSAASVYLFVHFELVDGSRIKLAFSRHWDLLLLNLLCLLLSTAASIARHKWLLSALVPVTWRAVTAANVVGLAIGQWAPGSTTVAEIARVGLLLGPSAARSDRERVSKVAMLSVFDRAIGVGLMFCCGAVAATAGLLLYPSTMPVGRLWVLSVLSLAIGVAVLWLPLSADAALTGRLVALLRSDRRSFIARGANAIASVLSSVGSVSHRLRQQPGLLVRSVLITVLLNVLGPLAYYLTSLALHKPIPVLLIAAILPTTLVASLLPLGFAGFGGPQLVAMTNFAAFGVPPDHVLEMTLVQNTLILAVHTTLGLCWGAGYAHQLRSLLRSGRNDGTTTSIAET
jgi:uncharacterized protein (TIRG00374 family)